MEFSSAAKTALQDIDEIRAQYVLDAPDANALFASEIVRSNGASNRIHHQPARERRHRPEQ